MYLVTLVERATRKFLAWSIVVRRTKAAFEALVDAAPPAQKYYSDAFPAWAASWYPGEYEALTDKSQTFKSQTFSVEAGNAEVRHYLARFARRSRCFSRCPIAMAKAVDLFVRTWNARQDYKTKYPKRKPNLIDFISL